MALGYLKFPVILQEGWYKSLTSFWVTLYIWMILKSKPVEISFRSFAWNNPERMLNGSNQSGLQDKTGDNYRCVNIYITLPIIVIHLLMSCVLVHVTQNGCRAETQQWFFRCCLWESDVLFASVGGAGGMLTEFILLQDSLEHLRCISFGMQHFGGGGRKSQGACAKALDVTEFGKYLESKHFDTSRDYSWGKHVFFFFS